MVKQTFPFVFIALLLTAMHYLLAKALPQLHLYDYFAKTHLILFLLFTKSHLLGIFLSKKFKVLPGQIFLGFSVFKLLFAGSYILILKRFGDYTVSKPFILVFMACYFIYLAVDVWLMVRQAKAHSSDDLTSNT